MEKKNLMNQSVKIESKNAEISASSTEKLNIQIPINIGEGVDLRIEVNYENTSTYSSTVEAREKLSELAKSEVKFSKDLFMESLMDLGRITMAAFPEIMRMMNEAEEWSDAKNAKSRKSYDEMRSIEDLYKFKMEIQDYLRKVSAELLPDNSLASLEEKMKNEECPSYNLKETYGWAKTQKELLNARELSIDKLEMLNKFGII